MFKRLTVALTICALAAGVAAQKKPKSWTEWSKKDAEKILNDSAWGQTQIESDLSEMFFTPTQRGGFNDTSRAREGATNEEVHIKFYVRFFTARPIRMAHARLTSLQNPDLQVALALKKFAEIQPSDITIVTLWFDATDQRTGGKVFQALTSAETSILRQNAYLERKDGKRFFLQEYVKPGKDGFGARFVFPRKVDGQPILTPDSGEVRFHAELGSNRELKVDRRFKIADMIYNGQLEY
ncbi:MAG: hypothetical protein LC754_07955 [Acidobacteria bacterium]|nr:hypothetical protein [Acidobacteriota bacterium]